MDEKRRKMVAEDAADEVAGMCDCEVTHRFLTVVAGIEYYAEAMGYYRMSEEDTERFRVLSLEVQGREEGIRFH